MRSPIAGPTAASRDRSKVGAGAAIVGREFDDAGSGGSGGTRVRVSGDPGGTHRITSTGAVARVHALLTGKPARLTIDLCCGKCAAGRSCDRSGTRGREAPQPETTTVAAAEGAPKAKPAAAAEPEAADAAEVEPVAVAATSRATPVAAAKAEARGGVFVTKPRPAPVVAAEGRACTRVVAKNRPTGREDRARAGAAAAGRVAPRAGHRRRTIRRRPRIARDAVARNNRADGDHSGSRIRRP